LTFLSASPLARNRNFRLLFAAQVISLSGSEVATVGLALFAHQLVGGSSAAAVIGNALMLRILAFLMFSQWPRLCRVFCTDSPFWLITYPAIGHGVSRLRAPLTFTLAGGVCLLIALAGIFFKKTSYDHIHE